MKTLCCALLSVLALAGCGPSGDASRTTAEPASKELLYQKGHQLYLAGSPGEAIAPLTRALEQDTSYVAALTDLATIMYEQSRKNDGAPVIADAASRARGYYARLESLGVKESDAYERLCELASESKDSRAFVRYAKKYADAFPYERQYYNLGLAYFAAGEYQNVIDSQKKAAEKFSRSQYLGAYYRQMGHAYIKLDRDQTAERVLEKGLAAVDARLAEVHAGSADAKRLAEDRGGMLVSLKRIYTIYKETEKLRNVEQQLREAGK